MNEKEQDKKRAIEIMKGLGFKNYNVSSWSVNLKDKYLSFVIEYDNYKNSLKNRFIISAYYFLHDEIENISSERVEITITKNKSNEQIIRDIKKRIFMDSFFIEQKQKFFKQVKQFYELKEKQEKLKQRLEQELGLNVYSHKKGKLIFRDYDYLIFKAFELEQESIYNDDRIKIKLSINIENFEQFLNWIKELKLKQKI